MKIIGLCGSLREGSASRALLRLTFKKLSSYPEFTSELIDLRAYHLPFCNGTGIYTNFPDLDRLKQKVLEADGIILASPEYHGCMSGVLKNALDLLDEQHFKGKTVALMSVLGGELSHNAVNTMRLVMRALHAHSIPDQLIISNSEEAFTSDGKLVNAKIEDRLEHLIKSLIKHIKIFRTDPEQ